MHRRASAPGFSAPRRARGTMYGMHGGYGLDEYRFAEYGPLVQCEVCKDTADDDLTPYELRERSQIMSASCWGCDQTLCENCEEITEDVECDACGESWCSHKSPYAPHVKPWEVKGCGALGCEAALTRCENCREGNGEFCLKCQEEEWEEEEEEEEEVEADEKEVEVV